MFIDDVFVFIFLKIFFGRIPKGLFDRINLALKTY